MRTLLRVLLVAFGSLVAVAALMVAVVKSASVLVF